jgi:hypothetical protein
MSIPTPIPQMISGHILASSSRGMEMASRKNVLCSKYARAREPRKAPVRLHFDSTPRTRLRAMATNAMIGIPAAVPRLRALPRRRPLLFSCSSSASPPGGSTAGFIGPGRNATLQQPSSSSLRRGLIVPNAAAGGASATSGSSGLLPTVIELRFRLLTWKKNYSVFSLN